MNQVEEMIAVAESALIAPDAFAGQPAVRPLHGAELRRAKRAYATGRFDLSRADSLVTSGVRPQAGDLLLAKVLRLGQHRKLESPQGRRQTLYADDLILVCYGARYASDQFEALVPDDLGPCDLVAAGGIAARCVARHSAMRKATEIVPLGLVADRAGRVLNLADSAEPFLAVGSQHPFVLAVVGTSMNAGKTTTVASMVRGLVASGLSVGAAKITGTGAGCDRWMMVDAGAETVLDFTDFGYASTYQVPTGEIARVLEGAVAVLGRDGVDVAVVELADGLLFPETARAIELAQFRRLVGGLVLAASDSMSAGFGADWLLQRGLPVLGIAGKLTASPLMMREAEQAAGLPVLTLEDLDAGTWTQRLGRVSRNAA